ncbi:MAG TPA: hypothetical protein VMZ28_11620 [Kofleriaceae bacterium]|nr:hypothetical protein [Kofleriaceae bacterium]
MQMGNVDVTVVLPFRDDEDLVGSACQRIAHHLAEQGLVFELIAVDEGSGDNSVALLALLRPTLPELRILHGAASGRGFRLGAAAARGRVLWLLEPDSATRSLSAFGRSHGRVARGELDLAVVRGRFAVMKRTRALGLIDAVTGRGASFERRLLKRAQRRHLALEAYEVGGTRAVTATSRLAARVRWRLAIALGAAEPRT